MVKRVAVFSDAHGNVHAFEEMYADAKKQGSDDSWFLGDLLMPGPGVKTIWQIFDELKPSVVVRGNWDDLVVNGARGKMPLVKPSRVYFARLAEYVAEHTSKELIDRLASWPLHQVVHEGGLTFGLSHNLPDLDMGQALFPTQPTENFDQLFGKETPDVAIYAHVHHALLRYASDERVVLNTGSVGEPFNGWDRLQKDTRAQYLILDIDDQGIANLNFRHVPYDRHAELELAKQAEVPYLYLYQRTMENGRVDTHNQELVDAQNKQYGYAEQYRDYCRHLNLNNK